MTTTPSELKEAEPQIRECRECQQPFELPPFRLAAELVFVCPDCSERHALNEQAEVVARSGIYRDEAWKQFCPPLFMNTRPDLLPNPTKLEKALQWQFGPRGLIFHGDSGKGKSRIAWQLLKREFMAGRSIAVLDPTMGFDYSKKFGVSPAEASKWVEHKMNVDLLLLDDVLKVKLTDSVEQALFAIVNYRTERGLPILFTTNDTGETLKSRMSEDRGPALLRRLKEFSTPIAF
jgi:hypothetical protein